MTNTEESKTPPEVDDVESSGLSWTGYALLIALFAGHLALLALVAWGHRYRIFPDAVSYLRIASYYRSGDWSLAVTGYWGPMLSWITAAFLGVVDEPRFAGRIAMVISAAIFWLGSVFTFRAAGLSQFATILGAVAVSASSALGSVLFVTPDFLMAGLFLIGLSLLLSRRHDHRTGSSFVAGLVLGAAYLAKAAALPMAVLLFSGIALMRLLSGSHGFRAVLKRFVVGLIGVALVAGPWVGVLSVKYGKPTFSTTAKIAHAFIGPEGTPREHPLWTEFHVPDEGRVTQWEEPTTMNYVFWSPFENWSNMRHQIRHVYLNALRIGAMFAVLDWLRLGLFAVVLGFIAGPSWREKMRRDRWRWSAMVLVAICAVYLPVFSYTGRYFYVAFPIFLIANFGLAESILGRPNGRLNFPRVAALLLIALSFASPAIMELRSAPRDGALGRADDAEDYARRLEGTDIAGPFVGNGPGNTGMYLAFFTNNAWYGDNPDATAEDFLASGASVAVVWRQKAIASALNTHPSFVALDDKLFASPEEAAASMTKLYGITGP